MIRTRVIVYCALLACEVGAQTRLTLSEAVRQAQTNHLQLQAARERVRAAEALRLQAGLRPNPRLTLQTENTRFTGTPSFSFTRETDNFAFLSQVFESGGKRARRLESAEAVVQTAESERAVLERQIAARVSLTYWSASAAQGLRNLLLADVDNLDRIVQYHRDRVREGAMAEVDLMRVELERDRIHAAAETAGQEATRALITLLREMGSNDFTPPALADRLGEVRDLPAPDVQDVLSRRPEMRAARRFVDETRARLGLQRALAKPDPDVLFGYKRTAGFDTLLGGLQIDLPFRNRNQGAIAAASADIRAAEWQLAETERQIRAEVAIAWADYQARSRLLTVTLKPMRERADEISRIAQAAYREGGTDLLRLLDAERARLDSLTMYYRALSDYQQSVTTLQIVTGAPL